MMMIAYESEIRRILSRIFGKSGVARAVPNPDKVVRRAERMRANRVSREAMEMANKIRRLDPMELELLGKRREQ